MPYFCHSCQAQVAEDAMLPEYTCPTCHSGFIEEIASQPRRRSSDDMFSSLMSSDDNSEDEEEFFESLPAPLAQLVSMLQARHPSSLIVNPHQNNQSSQSDSDTRPTDQNISDNGSQTPSTRSRTCTGTNMTSASTAERATDQNANSNQSSVLHDSYPQISFGAQFPTGSTPGNLNNQGASGSQIPAARGLINIDFPLPLFLHSSPGDYAWGNAGFDAVITQLLNNLDGSGNGPPPMPKDQIDELPKFQISEEQVKSNSQCSVCITDFIVGDCARRLPCDHIFHQSCIVPWLEIQSSCPICRKTFTIAQSGQNQASSNQSTTNTSTAAIQNLVRNPTTTSNAPSTNQSTTDQGAPYYDLTEDDCD